MTQIGQSINKAVHEIVASNLSYDQAVTMGYANLSALARLILPQLETHNHSASKEAIISALKRYHQEKAYERKESYRVLAESTISLSTDVTKLVVNRKRIQGLLEKLISPGQGVIYLLRMQETATLVLEKQAFEAALKVIHSIKRDVIEIKKGLTLITIHSPAEIIDTAGCVELIYRFISASGVNIEDTVSSYTDTLIVVKNEDAGAAFNSLNTLVMHSTNFLRK
ncbi:MAG: hypothetical protein JRN26_05830 [Nitrososphaerota archaeon]|jgi:aspartokinase|nr:hypothetical protein [Nitrososphaerota archaeon]MDG6926967.1 hypothetical protein [Nitrososphaerota archaeon]MDG6930472.1 hypothetical protein [Nitrososphaerota archaeon]MDG6931513.1 hypothetical protein [Nitrososphaerota archaeon]MDG6936382.1 hypothetical protein [Nitrososphaerota archaeon]